MSLFNPNGSPSVLVREVDLSSVVPAVSTSTGAYVGEFNWGPVGTPILVGNEAGLVEAFGAPTTTDTTSPSSVDFISATYFLKYGQSLYVSRAIDETTAKNAADSAVIFVANKEVFDESSLMSSFTAKYPGKIANSISVHVCGDSDQFLTWGDGQPWSNVKSAFDGGPDTSPVVAAAGGTEDEFHVAVVDSDGLITGTKGTILETYAYLSGAKDAKTQDGANNFIVDVINNKSEWVWMSEAKIVVAASDKGFSKIGDLVNDWGGSPHTNVNNGRYNFAGGLNAAAGEGDFQEAWNVFSDADKVQIDLAIVGNHGGEELSVTMTNYATAIAEGPARRDCVVVASPPRDAIIGVSPSTAVTATVGWSNKLNASSYLITDNNYLKTYDKYNDKYVFIPAASSTAGLMAATDRVAAPWFSPAGQRRGRYIGVTSLAYTPDKTQRDTLYKASVNPIVNLPGQGVLLYGDKTKEGRPSAFDRINVRRLFLAIERAIKLASANVLFEFNDEFTRAEFVNIVEPFLREIQGRRGITDFLVVCDETNNTAAVIDSNRFVASMFIKPARSINYVTLNFVAVRTGIEFQEVVGIV
jgi:hypothetical protein